MVEFFAELDQMLDEELGFFDPRPWHEDRPQRPKVWTPANRAHRRLGPAAEPDWHMDRDD